MMQVQISQRLSQPFPDSPLNLYRALRSINPSPYMFYFDFGDCQLVGASPEILVRREGDKVTLRPIAGTRKRGATPEKDLAMERELVSDPKERAEHLMLIDLGRNDVGRIAKIGTVKVTETMVVERYSHVMHMVSNVEGDGRSRAHADGAAARDVPGGHGDRARRRCARWRSSTSSSPSGAACTPAPAGYLGFNGNLDLAIAIRTGVVKDGKLHVQAAAGIVADSIPESEWLETQNKARALLARGRAGERGPRRPARMRSPPCCS